MDPIRNPAEVSWAKNRLGRFFMLTTDVFDSIPRQDVLVWAARIAEPNYKLTHQEHTFLIGRGW